MEKELSIEKKVSILIVDDEKSIRETLGDIFSEEGYEVFTAGLGKEAIERAREKFINIAIVDLKLPDMDGLEVIRALKQINPQIRNVMITAYGSMDTVIKVLKEGAVDYIPKPFEVEYVGMVIRKVQHEQRVAIERDYLLKFMHIEREKLKTLLEMGLEMSNTLDLNELANFIVSRVGKITRADKCSLMLLEENNGELLIQAAKGLDEKVIKESKVKKGESVAGWVAQHAKPLLVEDIRKYPHWLKVRETRYFTNSFLSLPLRGRFKLLGVLNVTDKDLGYGGIFNEEDYKFIAVLSHQIAAAIENAQLYSSLRQLAVTDALTGLSNHRYFYVRLEEEINRAERYKRTLSLIMLDIDDFKIYNDTYGHLEGDEVLRQIARLLKMNTRRVDTTARYGGEEMAIILPETGLKEAQLVAEKIREAVEKHHFIGEEAQPRGQLTISAGVTTFRPGLKKEETVKEADWTLYRAKREGKNRVCVFQEEKK